MQNYKRPKMPFYFAAMQGCDIPIFINLTPANIVEFHQETWLIYKICKTGIEVRLPLYPLFEGKGNWYIAAL